MNKLDAIKLGFLFYVVCQMLLPVNVFANKATLTGFPFFAYSNETRLMIGGFLIWDKQWEKDESTNRNTIITNTIVTANKQYLAFVLPRFSRNNGDFVYSADVIARRWADNYWGIGNYSREIDKEPFGWEEYKLSLNAKYRIWQHLSPGIELDLRYGDLYKKESMGLLDTQAVMGTEPAFYIGKGGSLTWDSTDNDTYPTHGIRYSINYVNYATVKTDKQDDDAELHILKGDFDKLSLNLNHYISPINGAVIATQTTFIQSENQTPFTFLPELGSRLRAYDSKRYIDKTMLSQRLEPRIFPSEVTLLKSARVMQSEFWKRTGFVAFSEFGQVAPHTRDINAHRWHWSNGFGIRYAIIPKDKLNFRMDFGWGSNTFNFIFQAREVF